MRDTDVHSVRSLCCRDTACCLRTLLHQDPCPATIAVAALRSAFLPAAHPPGHLGAPPGHLLTRMSQTPPTVTSFRSCSFSACSSWAVPWRIWFSFSNSVIRLEAEEQSAVRAQVPGPGLPLSASGPQTTITPSPGSERPGAVGWVPSAVHRGPFLRRLGPLCGLSWGLGGKQARP